MSDPVPAEDLHARIVSAFPDGPVPPTGTLVIHDGFDPLDKESAVQAFSGKTRAQLRELVGRGPTGWQGLWGVEELAFLEPGALRYYVEPFITHLLREEIARPQDLSFWLGYHLSEAVRIRGRGLFDDAQRSALIELARHITEKLPGKDDWAIAHRRSWGELAERLGGARR